MPRHRIRRVDERGDEEDRPPRDEAGHRPDLAAEGDEARERDAEELRDQRDQRADRNDKRRGDDDGHQDHLRHGACAHGLRYFAACGKAGSLVMSRGSCWMTMVALRFFWMSLMRSIDASVSARS